MRFDILTIFPEVFPPVLGAGVLRIAREKGLVEYHVEDIRRYATDRHRSVDDRPYGGGPGMVMMPEPVFRAVEAVDARAETPARRILLSPTGRTLTQSLVAELARATRLVLICGRYEGFDERIRIGLDAEEVSIGDYVLSGGEVPALVIVEAVTRLVPGVLGSGASLDEESFKDGLLEYPQYTRPVEFRGMRVPEVLLSGDHERIAAWRRREALERTRRHRPDLMPKTEGSEPP